MVTLEYRFIDDSIDQKEEDNAIYSDNPGNYVSEVKIFFPVSSLQWLWHKLNTNCIFESLRGKMPVSSLHFSIQMNIISPFVR